MEFENDCRPDNPDHISPKSLGLVGYRVTVSEPTKKEAELATQLLAPLRERLGLEPYTQENVLKPNILQRISNLVRRS